MTNYNDLSDDNKRKAIGKAREHCVGSILHMSWHSDENMVAIELASPLGPLDDQLVIELLNECHLNPYSLLVELFRDSDLSSQFDDWALEVAESKTYEIAAPVSQEPTAPPVVL